MRYWRLTAVVCLMVADAAGSGRAAGGALDAAVLVVGAGACLTAVAIMPWALRV